LEFIYGADTGADVAVADAGTSAALVAGTSAAFGFVGPGCTASTIVAVFPFVSVAFGSSLAGFAVSFPAGTFFVPFESSSPFFAAGYSTVSPIE